jgi:hypothetical protein
LHLLERARHFVAAKATTVALTVVLLAALTAIAVPAKAIGINSVTFDTSSCFLTQGGGSCGDSIVSSTGGNPVGNWLDMYTTSTLTESSVGASVIQVDGTATGSFTTTQVLPVAWNFTVNSAVNGVTSVLWSLDFQVTTSNGVASVNPSGTATIGVPVTGNTTLTVAPGTIMSYSIDLSVTGPPSDDFTVTVPGGSTLDINPVSPTPEPASFLLAGLGSMLLFLRGKLKR